MSPALVYNEGFSSCTYLVHHRCSVTPGNSCFSSHHCPFPPLWYHESCIKDVGQIHLIVHTHVPSTWRAGDRCVVLPLLWSVTNSACYLQDQIPYIYQRVYMPENIPLLPRKHKIACIHPQTANPGSEILYLRGEREAWDSVSG